MNCHQPKKKFCSFADHLGVTIVTNCIDCYMPLGTSKLITLQSEGKKGAAPNLVRSHLIAVYPEAAKKQLMHIRLMSKWFYTSAASVADALFFFIQ